MYLVPVTAHAYDTLLKMLFTEAMTTGADLISRFPRVSQRQSDIEWTHRRIDAQQDIGIHSGRGRNPDRCRHNRHRDQRGCCHGIAGVGRCHRHHLHPRRRPSEHLRRRQPAAWLRLRRLISCRPGVGDGLGGIHWQRICREGEGRADRRSVYRHVDRDARQADWRDSDDQRCRDGCCPGLPP